MTRRKLQVIPGEQFGELTIVEETTPRPMPSGGFKRMVLVRCSCGRDPYPIQLDNLRQRKVSRCRWCAAAARPGKERVFTGDQVNRKQAFRSYIRGAERRGLAWGLSLEQFVEIASRVCFYCGAPPSNVYRLKNADGSDRCAAPFTYQGIDRFDASEGYLPDNVLPCCVSCNRAKSDLTFTEFVAWIGRVHDYLSRKGVLEDCSVLSRRVISEGLWRKAQNERSNP